jgi:hypothetical protein
VDRKNSPGGNGPCSALSAEQTRPHSHQEAAMSTFSRLIRREASMMLFARFSAVRILLHLLAMLGDRCVHFHTAGIIRELTWAVAVKQ